MHTETVERGPENKNMGTLSLLFDRKGIIGPSDLIKYNGLAVLLHKHLWNAEGQMLDPHGIYGLLAQVDIPLLYSLSCPAWILF